MNIERYKNRIATILQRDYDLSPRASEMLINKFDIDSNTDKFSRMSPNEAAIFMVDGLLAYYKEKGV